MEGADNSSHSKRSTRRSSNSHISMSDTDSATSQVDSWHSPLRSESPLRSDDLSFRPGNDDSGEKNNMAIVLVDKYYSPVPSPGKSNVPASAAAGGGKGRRPWPPSKKPTAENLDIPSPEKDGQRENKPMSENLDFPVKGPSPVVVEVNKLVREEPQAAVKKVDPVSGGGDRGLEEGYGGGGEDAVGGERRSRAAVASILKRSERNVAVRRVALAFRVFEVIACLISFSVMAADKTEGWSGDSFDRYIEYRYSVAVNVIGFVYSGFQVFDLGYLLGTGKQVFAHHLRYHFDFSMDQQIIAYLLMSASSSAATRVDDWISNWGADEFTLMASASIAMSFLAFIAFAISSIISGYNLCNHDST